MSSKQKSKVSVKEIVLFGMLGALMYASKEVMAALPNIHLIGIFVSSLTVVFRSKALYPIYIFVMLLGLLNGFGTWWVPHLYLWVILWAVVMLLPKGLQGKKAVVVYAAVCSLHGFLYGVLYAPFQALIYHYDLQATLTWIATGLPFDIVHGISNLIAGFILIMPIVKLLNRAKKQI